MRDEIDYLKEEVDYLCAEREVAEGDTDFTDPQLLVEHWRKTG